jgi:hypothetical protein
MWSTNGRQRCFSGGNTTSNRIEASWNQFKQLLGKKTSIDKCVRVVIQQQVCVIRRLELALTHHEMRQPVISQLPRQLQSLGGVFSDYCLRFVQRQWDLSVLHCAKWVWRLEQGMYFGSRGYSPVRVEWSAARCVCDCVFFRSTMLPCQHL